MGGLEGPPKLDVAQHALVSPPAAVGERVPEAYGMGFVAVDERRDPARPLRLENLLGLVDEPSRQAVPPGLRGDRQPIDVAAPAVPSPDDGPDDGALLDRDEETVAVRADQLSELLERIGRARDRTGAFPQGQHRPTLVETAGSDHDHRGRSSPIRFAPYPGRPVSYGQSLREETHGDQA